MPRFAPCGFSVLDPNESCFADLRPCFSIEMKEPARSALSRGHVESVGAMNKGDQLIETNLNLSSFLVLSDHGSTTEYLDRIHKYANIGSPTSFMSCLLHSTKLEEPQLNRKVCASPVFAESGPVDYEIPEGHEPISFTKVLTPKE